MTSNVQDGWCFPEHNRRKMDEKGVAKTVRVDG